MTGHLRGGGGAGKKRSGQNKPLIRAPPGFPSPSKGQKNGEGSGHNTSRGKASTDTATGYSSILDTETPTGDYQYTTPEPDWCPYTWDKKTWEAWTEERIHQSCNHTHQLRENFDSDTQQFHSDDNPMGSFDAVNKFMRRMGFNPEARHHNDQIGIPWEDGPIPDRSMLSHRFHLAKDILQGPPGRMQTSAIQNLVLCSTASKSEVGFPDRVWVGF